jgi:hypothetical protein
MMGSKRNTVGSYLRKGRRTRQYDATSAIRMGTAISIAVW